VARYSEIAGAAHLGGLRNPKLAWPFKLQLTLTCTVAANREGRRKRTRGQADPRPQSDQVRRWNRRKGQCANFTVDTRSNIKSAAERHGSDGNGTGGEAGFLDFLIRERPSDFTDLYKRTIPPAKDDDPAGGSGAAPIFTIVPIQSGKFISVDGAELLDEAEARALSGAPLLVEPVTIEASAVEPTPDGAELVSFATGQPIDSEPAAWRVRNRWQRTALSSQKRGSGRGCP
jgi:hypothetical protein